MLRPFALDGSGRKGRLAGSGGEQVHRAVALGRTEGTQDSDARSMSAPPPIWAPRSATRLAMASSSRLPAPASSRPRSARQGRPCRREPRCRRRGNPPHVDDGQGRGFQRRTPGAAGRGPVLIASPAQGGRSGWRKGQREGQAEALAMGDHQSIHLEFSGQRSVQWWWRWQQRPWRGPAGPIGRGSSGRRWWGRR